MKKIKITVDMDGNYEVETEGFQGASCLEAVKALEDLGEQTEMKAKDEMHEGENRNYLSSKRG